MTSMTSGKRRVTQAQMDRLAEWSMRKPVIALMGEFSSGKSTLMNLLIGKNILPTQVTATRMPPVWLTYGTEKPYRMDHDGTRHRVDLSKTDSIPIRRTSYIRLFVEADILKHCDLIDTPGISDPNIKTEYWIRTIRYANAVMWCTHAGQAWRESERGSWESLPKRLRETSILLVTRKDKITSERDLMKIQRRLERETAELFNARMFVSLTNAIRARERGDAAAWAQSGAGEFSDMLEKIVEGVYMQRSFLLTRYVVGDGAAEPRQADTAHEIESGSLLGFVDNDAGESVPADTGQGAVAAEATVALADEADAVEEMTFKPPRQDMDLGSYRLKSPSGEAPEAERAEEVADEMAAPEAADPAVVAEEPVAEPEMTFKQPRKNVDLASYRLKDPSAHGQDADAVADVMAALDEAIAGADATTAPEKVAPERPATERPAPEEAASDAAAPEEANAVSDTAGDQDTSSNQPRENVDMGSYRLQDPSSSRQDDKRRVSMSDYRLKDPSLRDLVARVAEAGRRAPG